MKPALAVIAAWLIGIATASLWPGLATERTMLVARPGDESGDLRELNAYSAKGWTVVQSSPGRYYVLERPRLRP